MVLHTTNAPRTTPVYVVLLYYTCLHHAATMVVEPFKTVALPPPGLGDRPPCSRHGFRRRPIRAQPTALDARMPPSRALALGMITPDRSRFPHMACVANAGDGVRFHCARALNYQLKLSGQHDCKQCSDRPNCLSAYTADRWPPRTRASNAWHPPRRRTPSSTVLHVSAHVTHTYAVYTLTL